MESRRNQFTLEPINNVMTGSIMTDSQLKSSMGPPPSSNNFLLLDGSALLLLDSTNFKLLL